MKTTKTVYLRVPSQTLLRVHNEPQPVMQAAGPEWKARQLASRCWNLMKQRGTFGRVNALNYEDTTENRR